MFRFSTILGIAWFMGCGAASPTTWHKDVEPLIERKCGTCHSPGNIAPFSLKSLADFTAKEEAALDAIRTGRMPPFPGRQSCAEYSPTQALSEAEKQTIEKWVADGKREGNPAEFQSLPGAPDKLTRVDVSLPMKEPFLPTQAPDQYRCFLIDWPYDVPKFITGYQMRPGQQNLVHHADIFFLNPAVVAEWQARDAAQAGPGWECYDVPLGAEGSWIGTYVPGNRGVDFPAGTGLKVPPGTKIYIQVHYNTVTGPLQPDVSTLDLRLEDRVQKYAGVQALSDPNWILKRSMTIPANQKDVAHSYAIDPTFYASVINEGFVSGVPLKLYATTMHMHQLGQSARLEVERPDGSKSCAVDIPKWDFHWQLAYSLKEPIVINPGDKLKVTCVYDNTAQNQPLINGTQAQSKTRNWGTRTQDEMCVAGIYVTQ
jgi:Copper type II ascorbate-dependent monooxygenase, C-terminal domain